MSDVADDTDYRAFAKELAGLLARSAVERGVIEAALVSVMTALGRIEPHARAEMQKLVADFIAYPDDSDIVQRLGALLRNERSPLH